MELEGKIAPPMTNGELVFEEPWQGRVFGMTRALCEAGLYDWDEFRRHLIHEIDTWDGGHHADDDYQYFDLFLRAFVSLLDAKGICIEDDLAVRSRDFANRPHGHDHHHHEHPDHEHHQDHHHEKNQKD